MKIAILGTRGIPNNYGGFEQLAEYLSLGLRARGHDVYVYSSHRHKYQESSWKGVHIIHRFDPEHLIGTAGQFVYDFLSILNSRRHGFDVILNLGYTSSAVFLRFFRSGARVITNMDGLEWKRTKYSNKVRRFLAYSERLAVRKSDLLVADSPAIATYLQNKYGVRSHFIAYGADLFEQPDISVTAEYGVKPYEYNMLIARMEPENNLEMILDGMKGSESPWKFFVIGNASNKFGTYLRSKYRDDTRIHFSGPIYDSRVINNLRHYSQLYFHGHSVGGTNPSLLEAMGCGSLIAAHDNEFNRAVLGEDAYYFRSAGEVGELLNKGEVRSGAGIKVSNNLVKVRDLYAWEKIVGEYEALMKQAHVG
jgi:glycosyltransferase involved in cell wall biosynthesis